MSLVRKVTRLCISLVLITSSLALVPQVAQAAPGLDFYFKEEAGATAQMNLSPFTSGTCHVSRGDFNQNWGTNSPGGSCPAERFTLYGQGFIKAPATGTVSFYSTTDDGLVLRINEQTVISDLTDHGLGNPYNGTGSISMTEGQYYPIKFWFHENTGAAAMFLRWTYPGLSEPTLIPLANLDTEAPPQDTQNPVIVVGSGVLSTPTVEAGKTFSIQYRVTDDVACCNQHDVLFYNAQGQVAFQAPSSKIGGSQTDITYQAQVAVGVGITPGTYVARTQTTDLAGKFSFLQEIGSIQVTAPVPAAPTPSFSAVTSTADGFTTQINNYDPSFSWSVTTTAGVAAVSSSGLVTVTGLQPLASATVTVTNTKVGFTDGQATRSGTALDGPPVAVTPTFTAVPQISGTTDTAFATSVLDGCNAQISNYNSKLTWSGTSTFPGSTVTIGETGAIQVRGLGTQNNARITIVNRGANNTSGQANFDCNSWYPVLGIGERTTTSISMVINPISGVNFEFTPSSGVVSPLQGRNFTVSNLRSNVDVSLTVRALANGAVVWPRSGQGSGIFPLGKAITGQTQAALNFSLPANLVVGTPAQLSATGGSGTGAVSFVSNSTNICTVSGSTLTLINGGTCSITATKAGDSTFQEATATATATVTARDVPTVTITSPTANSTLNGSFTLSASIATAPGSTAQINAACLLIDGVNNNTAGVNNASRWWSYSSDRGPSRNCYGVQNVTSGTIAWSLDATTWTNGDHQLAIRVYDSANKESALVSVPVRVLNPAPEIVQITPADGAVLYGNFNIEVRWKSTTAVTHVGISVPCVSATRGAYQNAPSAQSAPAGLTYFNVASTGRDSFICQVDGSTQLGAELRASRKIDVAVIDRASQIATGSTSVALVTPKPTVEIRSPRPSQGVKGELLIEVWAQSPAESQRQISLVGISEADAKPNFNGNRTYYSDRLPSRFTAYRVSSSQAGEWLNFAWTLDLLEYKPGLQTIEVAVQDSNGDVVEKSIQFLVQEPEVQLSFIKPTINQKFAGDLEVKVLAKGDPLTKNKIRTIAIDLKELKPTFVGSELGDWQSKVPRNFRAWDLDTRNIPEEFTWTAEAGSIPNGTYTLSVIAIDDKNYSKTQTITFEVNTPNPEVRILSPEIGIIANQPFDIVASVEIPKIANAQVDLVGINIRDAVPAFVAQPVRLTNSNQLRDFIFWQVEDAKTFSWKINPDSWPDGNRSITILVLDTNKRVGQSSVALHKAPQANWKFEVKDPPVLGKSVAIGVTMTTSSQRLLEPVVTAKLQQASSPRGPWNDAGTLTFDKANIAAGRIVVTSPMYIRVYHENLDSVQPGASEPFRIINVPDPNRGGGSKSSGATNPDGSIPTVTCTPPARSVLNTRLTISCTAVDVQNPAQTFNVYQLQGKTFKRAGAARLTGNLISFSTTIRKSGTYTFEVRGESSSGRFTPWRSNRIVISIKK